MSSLNKEIMNAYKKKSKSHKKVIQVLSIYDMIGGLLLVLPLIPIVLGGPTLVYWLLNKQDIITAILWASLAGVLTSLFILDIIILFVVSSPTSINTVSVMFVIFISYIICYTVQFLPYTYDF